MNTGVASVKKDSISENIIYCFWTGNNEMSEKRKECLKNLKEVSECNVILVTPDNLQYYILSDEPLHEAYTYLSETHKADYLRTYFMHFYGGGYSDIKKTTSSWKKAFKDIENNKDCYINGAHESGPHDIGYEGAVSQWEKMVSNCAYICRPKTDFTYKWYSEMIELMDKKVEDLKKHPATYPQETSSDGNGYPLEWTEMLGRIFHKVLLEYIPNIMYTTNRPICYDHR